MAPTTAVRISLLGPLTITVAGRPARLTPITTAVLIRLLVADGGLVTVDELFRDVWPGHTPVLRREDRVSVQKRISELRRLLDPERPGEASEVLRTERGRVSAYRLVLAPDQVDIMRFRDLVSTAQHSTAGTAAVLFNEAVGLWRGRPLFDVEGYPFARRHIDELHSLYASARRDLLHTYLDLGAWDQAAALGAVLLRESPGDPALAETVRRLRERTRARSGVLRRDLPEFSTSLVVAAGDLLAQDDAHLVVGFTDTFDTSTDNDIIISRASLQGQLMNRLYADRRDLLDQELKGALRQVDPASVVSRATKRRGKLTRYPIGTVAALAQGGRRVFAVAYSTMGDDLVARSSMADLTSSLDRLWDAVYLHGQLRPVAIPLVGAGLARLTGATREDLITLIIRSFITRARRQPITRELRVVLTPTDAEQMDLLTVAEVLQQI